MDLADLASGQECAQGVRHVDPLKGMGVEAEYSRIVAGTSGLCGRIREMVVERWENGK